MVQPLKFSNGQVIWSHPLLGMYILIHAEIKVNGHVNKKGTQVPIFYQDNSSDHGNTTVTIASHELVSATYTPNHSLLEIPASREMLGRRWANVITYVGAMSVQRWHSIVTPPTMTLCQRFVNVITYCILFYLMVGTTVAQCIINGWLIIGITSLSPIACRQLRLR